MKKIVLLGYMGSGKSTIAKLLAEKLQLNALDLDGIIEHDTKSTISELFAQKGEIFFRRKEHELFKELLSSSDSFVLALGGGTPCYANNHELLNTNGTISIYLKASIATLAKRLSNSTERPLLQSRNADEQTEFIAKHLFDRSYFYNQAQHTITTDDKTPDEITTEIVNLLT